MECFGPPSHPTRDSGRNERGEDTEPWMLRFHGREVFPRSQNSVAGRSPNRWQSAAGFGTHTEYELSPETRRSTHSSRNHGSSGPFSGLLNLGRQGLRIHLGVRQVQFAVGLDPQELGIALARDAQSTRARIDGGFHILERTSGRGGGLRPDRHVTIRGAWNGFVEVREPIEKHPRIHRGAVRQGGVADRSQLRGQQLAHDHSQRDVHDVITRTASIGEPSQVCLGGVERTLGEAGDHAHVVLLGDGCGCDGGVEPLHFADRTIGVESRDARGERGDKVVAGRFRRGNAKQDIDQRGQGGMCDVIHELQVILGFAGIETVLVLQADDDLVNEGHGETGKLLIGGDPLAVFGHLTGRGPGAEHRFLGIRQEEFLGQFETQGRDIFVGQGIGIGVLGSEGVEIDEVEGLAQVHHERILALPHKHAALLVRAGKGDLVNVGIGILGIVRKGFVPDIVLRLGETRGTILGIGHGNHGAVASFAPDDVQGVALVDREGTLIGGGDGAGGEQGDLVGALITRGTQDEIDAAIDAFEAELEGEVLDGIARIVDVDFVHGVRIELEIVGAAVGILEWEIIGDEGDVPLASGFVTTEHVEIGAIEFGGRGDERSLAMTGGQGGQGGEGRQHGGFKKCLHSVDSVDRTKRYAGDNAWDGALDAWHDEIFEDRAARDPVAAPRESAARLPSCTRLLLRAQSQNAAL